MSNALAEAFLTKLQATDNILFYMPEEGPAAFQFI